MSVPGDLTLSRSGAATTLIDEVGAPWDSQDGRPPRTAVNPGPPTLKIEIGACDWTFFLKLCARAAEKWRRISGRGNDLIDFRKSFFQYVKPGNKFGGLGLSKCARGRVMER